MQQPRLSMGGWLVMAVLACVAGLLLATLMVPQ